MALIADERGGSQVYSGEGVLGCHGVAGFMGTEDAMMASLGTYRRGEWMVLYCNQSAASWRTRLLKLEEVCCYKIIYLVARLTATVSVETRGQASYKIDYSPIWPVETL